MIGGYVRDFPVSFARKMLGDPDDYLLNRLGEHFQFEINIGFNGKVWVNGRIADTIFIMNALERSVETGHDKNAIDQLMSVLK